MSVQAVSGWVQFLTTPDDRCGVVSRAIEGARDEPVADDLHVLSVTVQQLQSFLQRCVPLPGICPAYSHTESLLCPNNDHEFLTPRYRRIEKVSLQHQIVLRVQRDHHARKL